MKNGLEGVRERIRQAFITQVHGDQRTREQVVASQDLLTALNETDQIEIVESQPEPQQPYTPEAEGNFKTKAEALTVAALSTSHARRAPSRRFAHHRAFYVGSLENQPRYERVIEECMQALEPDTPKKKGATA